MAPFFKCIIFLWRKSYYLIKRISRLYSGWIVKKMFFLIFENFNMCFISLFLEISNTILQSYEYFGTWIRYHSIWRSSNLFLRLILIFLFIFIFCHFSSKTLLNQNYFRKKSSIFSKANNYSSEDYESYLLPVKWASTDLFIRWYFWLKVISNYENVCQFAELHFF